MIPFERNPLRKGDILVFYMNLATCNGSEIFFRSCEHKSSVTNRSNHPSFWTNCTLNFLQILIGSNWEPPRVFLGNLRKPLKKNIGNHAKNIGKPYETIGKPYDPLCGFSRQLLSLVGMKTMGNHLQKCRLMICSPKQLLPEIVQNPLMRMSQK